MPESTARIWQASVLPTDEANLTTSNSASARQELASSPWFLTSIYPLATILTRIETTRQAYIECIDAVESQRQRLGLADPGATRWDSAGARFTASGTDKSPVRRRRCGGQVHRGADPRHPHGARGAGEHGGGVPPPRYQPADVPWLKSEVQRPRARKCPEAQCLEGQEPVSKRGPHPGQHGSQRGCCQ